ncbi:MAG: hypothetical protein Q4D90_10550 [bacterium]|nr:hypothetical protein [bacterium]
MEEIYRILEEKIRQAGYDKPVDGSEIYDEICDEIEGKENGTYLFLSKREDDTFFEYQVTIMDEEFNLSYIDIHEAGKAVIRVDFD